MQGPTQGVDVQSTTMQIVKSVSEILPAIVFREKKLDRVIAS